MFRKFPNTYESIIPKLCERLDNITEPESLSSMVWILGMASYVHGFACVVVGVSSGRERWTNRQQVTQTLRSKSFFFYLEGFEEKVDRCDNGC